MTSQKRIAMRKNMVIVDLSKIIFKALPTILPQFPLIRLFKVNLTILDFEDYFGNYFEIFSENVGYLSQKLAIFETKS